MFRSLRRAQKKKFETAQRSVEVFSRGQDNDPCSSVERPPKKLLEIS
jgi:hypothetical protein